MKKYIISLAMIGIITSNGNLYAQYPLDNPGDPIGRPSNAFPVAAPAATPRPSLAAACQAAKTDLAQRTENCRDFITRDECVECVQLKWAAAGGVDTTNVDRATLRGLIDDTCGLNPGP